MPDSDGTMLDHAIILYGGNMSNSNLHNHHPLPWAVPGRGYRRIKDGRLLQYPQDTPAVNLMRTLLDGACIPVEKMGDSNGELAEV
jgi:hypothetical protein